MPDVRSVLFYLSFVRLSRSELVTTETDESAMQAPAITGESSPNAASGIPAVL